MLTDLGSLKKIKIVNEEGEIIDAYFLEQPSVLVDVLKELKKMNVYLSEMTGLKVGDSEIEEE